jgi:hypothetical protein
MLFKKIDPSSGNAISSALGFFETPPSNVGIRDSSYAEILTLNPITDVPFHFKVGVFRNSLLFARVSLLHPLHALIDSSRRKLPRSDPDLPRDAYADREVRYERGEVDSDNE